MNKSNGQIPAIINYVTEHPGCYLSDIIRATKVPKCSATAALSNLTKAQTLRREGMERRFRYYAIPPEDRPVVEKKKRPACYSRDEVNTLTNLFNQRLAEARSGR
ncbi:hypothetical protein JDT53_12535 [Escherichia coli]|nr:hypothetical protein [Escherichia coli]EJS6324269.1 hypothetical protein [Escherichia coli]EKM0761544.1 hypothetical protein [Escherichia coli]EKQ6353134.1 hypothetical protein [Escherichia coli]ELI4584681.1 hypothetical protein [Escherichia coli]